MARLGGKLSHFRLWSLAGWGYSSWWYLRINENACKHPQGLLIRLRETLLPGLYKDSHREPRADLTHSPSLSRASVTEQEQH